MDNIKENISYIIIALSPFILYYIYYVITSELMPVDFPPRTARCPDYWVYNKAIDGNENTHGCFGSAYPNYNGNISNYKYTDSDISYNELGKIVYARNITDTSFNHNIGNLSDNDINMQDTQSRHYIDFDVSYNTLCEKYEWAKQHNITWSGISSLDPEYCKVVKEEEDTSKDILDDYRDYASWYKNNFKNENTWHNQVSSFRDTNYIKNVLSYILLGTILIGICVGIKVACFPNESSMGKKTNYTSVYLIFIVILFLIINQMI